MKLQLGIVLMIISSACACVGQLFWKYFVINNNIFILLFGFFFYGIGAVLMIISYRFGPLSVLQPILSLNYVLSIFLGYFILKEVITFSKSLGVVLIIIGVCCIARESVR